MIAGLVVSFVYSRVCWLRVTVISAPRAAFAGGNEIIRRYGFLLCWPVPTRNFHGQSATFVPQLNADVIVTMRPAPLVVNVALATK